jgi:hypothetical protein
MTSGVLTSRVVVEPGRFRWVALRVLGVLGDGSPWWWMLMMLDGDVVVEAVKVVHESGRWDEGFLYPRRSVGWMRQEGKGVS